MTTIRTINDCPAAPNYRQGQTTEAAAAPPGAVTQDHIRRALNQAAAGGFPEPDQTTEAVRLTSVLVPPADIRLIDAVGDAIAQLDVLAHLELAELTGDRDAYGYYLLITGITDRLKAANPDYAPGGPLGPRGIDEASPE
ncbi:hypothetical protein [uncultured Thiodictyon sp.]|uniref:hypothetical protein n=1 Tax=uncultured Thiodictyon sp. TaxID=1846217 RepID=UPI0025D6A7F2|nr:hypothetical protein [uncultured Thiodictyon sp.]